MKILAFDVETGGLSPDRHALTQIALLACTVHGERIEVGPRFVRPVRPAPNLVLEDDALAIQGHTRRSLLARPGQIHESELMREFHQFLAGLGEEWQCAPLVAHNAKFDHGFLDALCRRTKTPLLARDAICTIERHREAVKKNVATKPENYKLATLVKALGLTQNTAHDAGQDAQLAAALFAWQEARLSQTGDLLSEGSPTTIVGRIYQHIPAAEDGWWTKHGGEYPTKPVLAAPPPSQFVPMQKKPAPVFNCSRDLVELHRRAKAGELPPLVGWRASAGPIEDANRYVCGAFAIIRKHLEDLEMLNGAVIGTEKREGKS